jgi:hypothetical protein
MMILNRFHKKYIDHVMLEKNTQIKTIVEDLFQNEDVVSMKNSNNNEDILSKQMHIEYQLYQIPN